MKRILAALSAGALFGAGLDESNMADPRKVLAFLDVFGQWDPSLLWVMVGAVTVYAIGYRLLIRRDRPWLAHTFNLPTASRIDVRLLGGMALFGIGWGLSGYCPGPALAGLGLSNPDVFALVPSMLFGGWIADYWSKAPSLPVKTIAAEAK
ncbi:MAG TPA: YeeE/YedE family protein [Dyella sp.]|uniref:YeeE/YedE family protein n=1 Tax=Dyella sp. TaxID=1869338 RepID=UPI002BF2DF2B|nr:YeeE/YedE family protein [Dyella sp.]HTV87076.1 YeeE/YedE family protein [Dyella sp.]